jgi:hypothetical protein
MAHPVYRNAAGVRLPSVTTVINKLKEADGMIYAAWKLGSEGKDYKAEWADKANSGTLAHSLAHNEEVDLSKYPEDIVTKAKMAHSNYLKWFNQSKLECEASEISLVCECHQTGGTIDDVWIHEGERSIGDLKTGKIYYSHLIQVACYRHLWEVNHPDKPINGGFHLLHFDKETADFGHNHFSNLDDAWEAFIHFRALYDITNKLKERL